MPTLSESAYAFTVLTIPSRGQSAGPLANLLSERARVRKQVKRRR